MKRGTSEGSETSQTSTAGLSFSEMHTKNKFANEPEGLRQFQDHRWKVLSEKNLDLRGIFFCDHFSASYFKKTSENMARTKIYPEELDSSCRIL